MTHLAPYLYATSKESSSKTRALILLPEIFGVKDFTRDLAAKVESEIPGWKAYVLDHFYAVTGKVQTFEYGDIASGSAIMQQMRGEQYIELLKEAIAKIQLCQPHIERLAIWGFCFGGKLAWLSGSLREVTDIVSFYGGASLVPGFWSGVSAFDALLTARYNDDRLSVFAAYGQDDSMIPANDRQEIQAALENARIRNQIQVYDAGHAFFNDDRSDRYNQPAAQVAWTDVKRFLST